MSTDDLEAQALKPKVETIANFSSPPPTYGTIVETQLPACVAAGHVCRRRPHADYRGTHDCCGGLLMGIFVGIVFGLAVAGLLFMFLVFSFIRG